MTLLLSFVIICVIKSTISFHANRLAPGLSPSVAANNCHPGLCAGPSKAWIPSSPNTSYYAEFNVPPLPQSFSAQQTYFIYYNIIFKSDSPYATNNQFVPQLMLGHPLCDSTGAPYYNPIWKVLNQWHIGAQYFFFIKNESASGGRSGHAATGDLIDVYEGDIIYTQFNLSEDGEIWTLTMGIKGNDSAVSVVKADKPFMGLDEHSQSWKEDAYNVTRLGCCWELYGITERENYPNYMDYKIDTKAVENYSQYWSSWGMVETPNCSYSPTWNLTSTVSNDKTEEVVLWDIFYK
eukprot:441072_1